MKTRRCKGTRDLSPEEMIKFRLIEGVFRDCCLKGGYQEIRTPTLEYLHLFTSTGTLTPAMLGKVYSFLDWDGWSGERVVLRPDGTIPVARLYIDTMEKDALAKLFYITNIFIFEETGKETREKWQCGAELIGAGSTMADAELITLALDVLKKLGLENVELKLSHAGLIRALLARFGLDNEEQARMFDQILDGDTRVLTSLKARAPELRKTLAPLLDLKGKSSGFLKNLKTLFNQEFPEFELPLGNFIGIVDLLESLGHTCQIDIASGKGFEYYTGVIFQLFAGRERVAGGGRYDALIPLMGGRDIPASGFALYLDPLMKLVKSQAGTTPSIKKILVRPQSDQPETVKKGFQIATSLRKAGFTAELDLAGQKPSNLAWMLDVNDKPPLFVLTDRSSSRKHRAQTAGELLAILRK
jgi:histidyl-tRNA synthetase